MLSQLSYPPAPVIVAYGGPAVNRKKLSGYSFQLSGLDSTMMVLAKS
jgi:hypothetical protein